LKILGESELVGLLLVLLLTGGLDSPLLWYAINPILLATTFLPLYFCWCAGAIFLFSAVYLQQFVAQHPDFLPFLWSERAHLVLIFILITVAAQLFYHLNHKLSQQTTIMEEQLEHIKSLYEVVGVFSRHDQPQEAINLFTSYSKAMTGATKVILWTELDDSREGKKTYYAIRGPRHIFREEKWYPYVKRLFESREHHGHSHDSAFLKNKTSFDNGELLAVTIKSSSNSFGLLTAFFQEEKKKSETESILVFLAELCAAVLDRRCLEAMSERLLLAEEKERIARQMHDTVTQNVFGIIHGLNTILQKDHVVARETVEQITLLQKVARNCLKDLRSSIYNLSCTKKDEVPFVEEIETYLSDLERLNNLEILFDHKGNFNEINSIERNTVFRIIREATSNALRHGSCHQILVNLEVFEQELKLVVADDGKGFEKRDLLKTKPEKGLGILSMKELVRNMGGEFNIKSDPGGGAEISCCVKRYIHNSPLSGKEGATFENCHY